MPKMEELYAIQIILKHVKNVLTLWDLHYLWEINSHLHEFVIILSFQKTKAESLILVLLV